MSDMQNELLSAFEEFKAKNDQRLDELAKGKADVVLSDQVDRINDAVNKIEKAQQEALRDETLKNELADIKQRVYEMGSGAVESKKVDEEKSVFIDYVRDAVNGHQNAEVNRKMAELNQKAVTIGTATAGGNAVPAPIANEVFQKVLDISPIINRVRRTNVMSPLYERLVDSRGFASGWAGEGDTRSETSTPTLNQVTFTHGELYAVPKASNWSLNDLMFDVENWLVESAAEEYDYALGAAITTGDGTSKPTGILAGTPVAVDDELATSPGPRAFGTIEYIPTGVAAAFPFDRISGSPAGNPGDVLIDTTTALKPRYQRNAAWYMNRTTMGVVRKWKDADGHYLWQPALSAGTPSTLLGYDVVENEHMADEGANAFPVMLADLQAGYELILIQGMRLIRDEVTSKGHTLFYLAQRFGGKIVNDDAIKVIKCATS